MAKMRELFVQRHLITTNRARVTVQSYVLSSLCPRQCRQKNIIPSSANSRKS